MQKKIDVGYVANLARIKLAGEEIKKLEGQFAEILAYIEKLSGVDTSNVPPTSHILPVKNILREDKVKESLAKDQSLSNAPDEQDNGFKVPRID